MQKVKLLGIFAAVSIVTIGLTGCSKSSGTAEVKGLTGSETKAEKLQDPAPKSEIPSEGGANATKANTSASIPAKDSPTAALTPAKKDATAQAQTTPKVQNSVKFPKGCVGTYNPVLSKEQIKKMTEFANTMKASSPQSNGKKVDVNAEVKKLVGLITSTDLNLKADGTFTISGFGGKEQHGTYTATGNKLTLIIENGQLNQGPGTPKPLTLTFNEKTKTLTGDGKGEKMVFKKKNSSH
jgi:hypothetical protein